MTTSIETREVRGHLVVAQDGGRRSVCVTCGVSFRFENMLRKDCGGPPPQRPWELLTAQQRRYLEIGHAACGHRVKSLRTISAELGVVVERVRQVRNDIRRQVFRYLEERVLHERCSPLERYRGAWAACLREHWIFTAENDALVEALYHGIRRDLILDQRISQKVLTRRRFIR
jgi:hypothetical protein